MVVNVDASVLGAGGHDGGRLVDAAILETALPARLSFVDRLHMALPCEQANQGQSL
jgi:hypothetical protein